MICRPLFYCLDLKGSIEQCRMVDEIKTTICLVFHSYSGVSFSICSISVNKFGRSQNNDNFPLFNLQYIPCNNLLFELLMSF